MRARRGAARDAVLTDGPGKLCQALAIDRRFDGVDVCGGDAVTIVDDGTPPPPDPVVTPRIGIRVGTEALWRWVSPGS